jgi:hypothetical protein
MVLTNKYSLGLLDIANFNKGLPISILSINTIQNLEMNQLSFLNMLNGMYYCYKNEPKKATLFFETAIKQGNRGDEKSDLSFTHQEYSSFIKKRKI